LIIQAHYPKKYHERIRKWVQRHPEMNGEIISHYPRYILEVIIESKDIEKLRILYNYFEKLGDDISVYRLKSVNVQHALRMIPASSPLQEREMSEDLGQTPGNPAAAALDIIQLVPPSGTKQANDPEASALPDLLPWEGPHQEGCCCPRCKPNVQGTGTNPINQGGS